jgi:hypothetical protein
MTGDEGRRTLSSYRSANSEEIHFDLIIHFCFISVTSPLLMALIPLICGTEVPANDILVIKRVNCWLHGLTRQCACRYCSSAKHFAGNSLIIAARRVSPSHQRSRKFIFNAYKNLFEYFSLRSTPHLHFI